MKMPKPSPEIAASRRKYGNQYAHLNGDGEYDVVPRREASAKTAQETHTSKQRSGNAKIEQKARELQREIWRRRYEFWPDGVPTDPVKLLDLAVAAECRGYRLHKPEHIGDFEDRAGGGAIAGLIDRDLHEISVANHLPFMTHRFTAAHELGHAVLHTGTGMHRDRAVDGSSIGRGHRDKQEAEADKFATYFLMPEKLVRERFKQIFGFDCAFMLTDDKAFSLDPADPEGLMRRCRTVRDLSRVLATAEQYNGRLVRSLADQFGVSPEAMAIRLEELGLVTPG